MRLNDQKVWYKVLALIMLLAAFHMVRADCLISWDANPADEQVTGYRVYVDGVAHAVTTTSVACSAIPVDPHVGRHEVLVTAVNDWGESEPSATLPFGSPGVVGGVRISRPEE